MTLLRYLAARYLRALGLVLGVLGAILVLIEMIEQLRRHASTLGIGQIGRLAVLKASEAFYESLPLVALIASVVLFVGLARSSELVATRAAGRSAVRALAGPVLAAVAFGMVAAAVLNPLAATARRVYLAEVARLNAGDNGQMAVLSAEGLWLRQATPAGQMVIHASEAGAAGAVLLNAAFLDFDPEARLMRRIEAREVRLRPGYWELHDAKLWRLSAANPENEAEVHETLILTTDLTDRSIRESIGASAEVSVWDLPRLIADLERAGFSTRSLQMQLQGVLALPGMMAAMALLAAAFTLRASRAGGTGTNVMLALLAGFGTYFLARFATVMGETGRLPVLLAAWGPALVGMLLALALLLHREEG